MTQKTHADKPQEADTPQLHHQTVPDQSVTHQAADALQRARRAPPSRLSPANILALQKTVGNRAVQRHIWSGHADLAVNQLTASQRRHAKDPGYAIFNLGTALHNVINGSQRVIGRLRSRHRNG